MNTNRHHPKANLPSISAATSRAIDQLAISKYAIPGVVLMENAARGTTDFLLDQYSSADRGADRPSPASVGKASFIIVCGKGNNGGDGWAIARQLVTRGEDVRLISIPNADELSGDAAINCQIALRLNLNVLFAHGIRPHDSLEQLDKHCVVIDAMLGTGIKGTPRAPYADWIEFLNALENPIVAIDIPSGLDADSGTADIAIKADHTCTFVRPKHGLMLNQGPEFSGEIHVLDIGIPDSILNSEL